MTLSRRISVDPASRENPIPRHARIRRIGAAFAVAVVAAFFAGPLRADPNHSLYLVDSQFPPDLQTRVFSVDRTSGALEVRAELGTDFAPVLAMAAASRTVLYMAGSDNTPANRCGGNFCCLLLRVVLDPQSTTPAQMDVVGQIFVDGAPIYGFTGMTFGRDGVLYAFSQDNSGLYAIDTTTAAATLRGFVDLPLHGGDLTIDGNDRWWLWSNIGAGSGLYQLDPVTLHASAFDLHPNLDLAGLTALGHQNDLWGASQGTDFLYQFDPDLGFTGTQFGLTLNGDPFDHRRGDMDSPYCESDEDCTDGDPCTSDQCTPGGCRHPAAPNGTQCNDGNACTQTDACQAGVCTGTSPVVCTAPDACHNPGTCNPASGACENAPSKPDGTACNDGNFCTIGEACQAGLCTGGMPRDADGDSRIDALCGGTDCNDANPLVWSAPFEVTGVGASDAGLTWESQDGLAGPETSYDLASGPLPGGPGFSFGSGGCLQIGGGTTFVDSRPDPAPDQGYWYLVRGRNSCGVGTYGSVLRDSSIPPCP